MRTLYSTIEFLKDELIQKLFELQKNELYYKKDVERKNRDDNSCDVSSISDNYNTKRDCELNSSNREFNRLSKNNVTIGKPIILIMMENHGTQKISPPLISVIYLITRYLYHHIVSLLSLCLDK